MGYNPQSASGLSPRVRGNRMLAMPPPLPARSIPACAGEPCRVERLPQCLEVYPRVCGGTHTQHRPPPYIWGLSPRVRGNRTPRE